MPIYEYRCQSCHHEFEAMQKFSDALLTDCPACGKATLTKLVSAAGFQLKGTGWYATDFKGGSKKNAASETKSEAKSDAAAASPTETKKTGCGSGGCGHNH
jgi:putative FmdB family regulatory protein